MHFNIVPTTARSKCYFLMKYIIINYLRNKVAEWIIGCFESAISNQSLDVVIPTMLSM